jgi:cystathionine beta-lyase/cystathionine gamma-synthase
MKNINSNKTPIYRDAGFFLKTAENTVNAFKDENENVYEPENYIYSRYRNPTVIAVEKKLAEICDSQWCMLVESGMAAIDIALSIFQEKDDNKPWLFFTEIYGGTNSFIDTVLIPRRGIKIERFAPDGNNYSLEKYIETLEKTKPKLVYFETVSNPMLIVADCKRLISEAKKRDIFVIIDNTFPTAHLFNPLNFGADLIIESATKYLSGHGDLTAGIIYGNKPELLNAAIEYRKWVGHMIGPDDAYRLGSQLLTFNLRFAQQIQNAEKLALMLSNHEKIEKVYYPGLKQHPTYQNAIDLFENRGFGAIISFQLSGKSDEHKRNNSKIFIEKISEHFELIPSLGDCNTIFMPIDAVWGNKYPFPGTIRLSLGIEDFNFIEKVITKALDAF